MRNAIHIISNNSRLYRGIVSPVVYPNILTGSNDFNNPAWVRTNATITTAATTGPDSILLADKLIATAISSQHFLAQSLTKATDSLLYTFTIYTKPAEYSGIVLDVNDAVANGVFAAFDLSASGSITSSGPYGVGWSDVNKSISLDLNGFYKLIVSTVTDNTTVINVGITMLSVAGGSNTFTGNGTSGVYIANASLKRGQ